MSYKYAVRWGLRRTFLAILGDIGETVRTHTYPPFGTTAVIA